VFSVITTSILRVIIGGKISINNFISKLSLCMIISSKWPLPSITTGPIRKPDIGSQNPSCVTELTTHSHPEPNSKKCGDIPPNPKCTFIASCLGKGTDILAATARGFSWCHPHANYRICYKWLIVRNIPEADKLLTPWGYKNIECIHYEANTSSVPEVVVCLWTIEEQRGF